MFQVYRTADRGPAIEDTLLVLESAANTRKILFDMESGFRAYLLTGDTIFLDAFLVSRKLIAPSLDQLEHVAASKLSELESIASIRSQLQQWLEYAESIRTIKSKGGPYQSAQLNLEGKTLIDAMRDNLSQLRSTQLLLLKDAHSRAQDTARNLLIWGSILSILLAALLGSRLLRRYQKILAEGNLADTLLQRLKTIADVAPLAMVYLDRQERYQYSNNFYLKLFKRESVVGRTAIEVLGENAYSSIKPHLEKAFSGQISTLEVQYARDDGPPLHIRAVYAPSLNSDGQVEGVVTILEDISERKNAELRFKQSQEGLIFALQSARMGTWELNLENQTVTCSQEMLKLWGLTHEEFSCDRASLQNRVHPADLEKMNAAIDFAIEQGGIYEFEYRIFPSPGQERWVTSRGRCTYEPHADRPSRFSGVAYDITERKVREAKNVFLLRAVSNFSKAYTPTEVLEISNSLCSEAFGAKSALLAVANPSHTRLEFVARVQNDPHGFTMNIHDGLAIDSNSAVADVYRTAQPCFIGSRAEREQFYPDTQGPEVRVEAFAYIPIHHRGKITGVLGILFDEQKYLSKFNQTAFLAMGDLVGQALERSQLHVQTQVERDHYRAFFALSSNGSAEIDATSHQLIRVNHRFMEIIGYTQDELLQMNFLDLIDPADRLTVKTEFEKASAGENNTWRLENRFRKKNGTIAWVIVSGTLIRDMEGHPIRFLIATLDISDLKGTEVALKNAIRARDQFLSIASHELRTPLTSLQLLIQLRQRDLNRKFPEAFSKEKIEAGLKEQYGYVDRIAHLVDDILDVSRISEGRLGMQFERFDLCEMVNEVIGRFRITADASHVDIRLKACVPVVGKWDRFRLEQVLLNLLTNAVRYGNKKPISVEVDDEVEKALLIVRDEGIGIKPEDQARVFERFERAVSENEVSGLGLGLFISNEIVLAHGGKICLTSKIGRGSEFRVILPNDCGESL